MKRPMTNTKEMYRVMTLKNKKTAFLLFKLNKNLHMLQEFFFYSQPATSVDAVIKICDVCSIDKISCSKSLLFYCGSILTTYMQKDQLLFKLLDLFHGPKSQWRLCCRSYDNC